ncbi:penicillin acylase family protein [Variovorax robiniae]|uniref:Penicillin acylase family protein n=1 Tax=Variovorax robiniae TaxID=1836199 RepID=A0ABU8XCI5_9BURK
MQSSQNPVFRRLGALCVAAVLAGCAAGTAPPADSGGSPAGALTIKRDSYGVPHVYANDTRGLFHGFGYAVAEDRLFQMEMARRAVLGTVSEVMGPDYVALDKGSRSGFTPASIRAQLAKLPADDAAIFAGYAAGFNARVREVLADKSKWMPKQFIDAGFEPKADWTDYDVAMVWIGTMANRFSNASSEIANLRLLNQLKQARGDVVGKQLFDQILWLEDPLAPTTVPRTTKLAAQADSPTRGEAQMARLGQVSPEVLVAMNDVDAARRGVVPTETRPTASNLWIAGPSKTTDGSTVFINGPQFGWVNPSYVFAVGLHGAGFDVTGNTPFAHPVVLFGTNGKISWGATAGPQDVNDIYQEKLNPANPHEYLFNGQMRKMGQRTEVIKVKGAPDVSLDVYSTVHGLVTSFDVPNNAAYSMRRSWDGLELESMVAWIRSMQAQNWTDWLAQARRVAITINWYYADTDGNIGYVSPARLPIRPASQDVRLPAIGDGSMEWAGFRPFSDVPQVLNPAQGYISNWNNQPAPGSTGDGNNYGAVDRVNEFNRRFEAKPRLTPDEVWRLNYDTAFADTNARYFISFINEATKDLPPGDPVRQAAQTLARWNMLDEDTRDTGRYEGAAATIMREWLPIMYRKLLQADLPPALLPAYSNPGYANADTVGSIRPGNGSKLLYNALLGSRAGVPQTIDFFHGADKNAMIRSAMSDALAQLTTRFGADQSKWLTPVTRHTFLPKNFIGAPQAGPDETLTLPTYMNRGTQNHKAVLTKQGVTLCTVAPPGQSGFIAPDGRKSGHYADQMQLYKDFGCKPEWLTPAALDANLESTKVLKY